MELLEDRRDSDREVDVRFEIVVICEERRCKPGVEDVFRSLLRGVAWANGEVVVDETRREEEIAVVHIVDALHRLAGDREEEARFKLVHSQPFGVGGGEEHIVTGDFLTIFEDFLKGRRFSLGDDGSGFEGGVGADRRRGDDVGGGV